MNQLKQYYLIGKDVQTEDLHDVRQHPNFQLCNNKRFLGSDFALENLEALLQSFDNDLVKQPLQIFLIGSTSFPMAFLCSSETFLRRYPRCKSFFDRAVDGDETTSYNYHKVLGNVHVYVINIYKRHTDKLTICL